eukprot:jgi/Botrbrau1/4764/Bobra.0137s0036.1
MGNLLKNSTMGMGSSTQSRAHNLENLQLPMGSSRCNEKATSSKSCSEENQVESLLSGPRKPTFVMVPKFRDPQVEAAYQATALNIKIAVDGSWILYAAVVDILIFWKLGFQWLLGGCLHAPAYCCCTCTKACPAFLPHAPFVACGGLQAGSGGLHSLARLVLWWEPGYAYLQPVAALSGT